VVATARSIEPSNDDEVLAVPGDIADRKTAERAISEGMARFGRIDTLVNNAGIFIAKPFTQYTEVDYAAMLGVNIAGFFHRSRGRRSKRRTASRSTDFAARSSQSSGVNPLSSSAVGSAPCSRRTAIVLTKPALAA
jgi:NAD(P)-dependent dehydrogenase (short-subunit alcohol dehydrogenase family)